MKITQISLGIVGALISISINCQIGLGQVSPEQQPAVITELRSLADEKISLPPRQGHLVVCFLGIECPLGKLYAPRIKKLATEYSRHGFQFVAVNSNRQDSTQEWREFTGSLELNFPVVKDFNNRLADQLKISRNPEVVVMNDEGDIRYRGRIDDQYSPGIQGAQATRDDLKLALAELSAGKPVSVPTTEPAGCLIGRVKQVSPTATVTYAKDIAPIFQQHCVQCHRPDEIGPFAMVDYDEIAGWSDMILETIDNGRMPPWHADPTVGQFANARGLSDREKQLIHSWVDQGAPLGDPADLPEPQQYTSGWRLPKEPDLVLSMRDRPFQVPAEGTVDYQYFVVDPKFKEDKWVTAAEIIPGNRSVLHHSIVFVRPPDGKLRLGLNWLEAYVPGKVRSEHVPHRARKIPAGSRLVFQQHYTPNGQPTEDLTKIGLIFADAQSITQELVTLAAINQEFEIEPYQASLTVSAQLPWLPKNGRLLSVAPHMHFRGKSFVAQTVLGDAQQPILKVPNYDFNWQHVYEFDPPLTVEQLDSINVKITFDNSADNPFNPDPSQYVVWGDQTWEEMAIGFFDFAIPRKTNANKAEAKPDVKTKNTNPKTKTKTTNPSKPAPPTAASTDPQTDDSAQPAVSESVALRAKEFTQGLFAKRDANGDGQLTLDEMDLMTRRNFRRYDTDSDGVATLQEVESAAQQAYRRSR